MKSRCKDQPKTIGLTNLTAKILCKAHNSMLSDLDDAALACFNVLREHIRLNELRQHIVKKRWSVNQFSVDGPLLERWFLKTLINISFNKNQPIGLGIHPAGTVNDELVKVCFGIQSFPEGAGLYLLAKRGEFIDSMDRVNITGLHDGTNVIGGEFVFRGFRFFLSLLPGRITSHRGSDVLYREFTMNCRVAKRLSHVIHFKWSV